MAKQTLIRILSPDGFTINREGFFKTKEEAKAFFKAWLKGYERQGYYSAVSGRISLSDLPHCCEFENVTFEEADWVELSA